MSEPLIKKAIDAAKMYRRLAQLARLPQPERIWGPVPIPLTEAEIGDVALFAQRGKWRYGIVRERSPKALYVTFVTAAGLDNARRQAHYHQNVKLDDYPETTRRNAPEGQKEAAYERAFIEHYVTTMVKTEPWVAWTPVGTTRFSVTETDRVTIIRD